ncbi:hypothetical protein PQX77_001266 [Marasmius sp. AFHP31]|nr:hypothetical protein PQX77_001266 [Marasmius sp. AFHP31]
MYGSVRLGYSTGRNTSQGRPTASANCYNDQQQFGLPSYLDGLPEFNDFNAQTKPAATSLSAEGAIVEGYLRISQHDLPGQLAGYSRYKGPQRSPSTSTQEINFKTSHGVASNLWSLASTDLHTCTHSSDSGSPGMPQLVRGAEHHHDTSPITSPDAFPISAYAPSVYYPTNHLPMGRLPNMLQTADHAYGSRPYDAFRDGGSLSSNYNTVCS